MFGCVGTLSCCLQPDATGPLIINAAPTRCFRKETEQGPGWESDTGSEVEADAFEHFVKLALICEGHAVPHKSPLQRSGKRHGRGNKALQLAFDHESTFQEDHGSHTGDRGQGRRPLQGLRLISALRRGRGQEVAELLRESPERVNERDKFGQGPIFFASALGNLDLLQALLECRAQVECANKFGYTPLMRALCHGCVAMAEELVRQGADANAREHRDAAALQLAAAAGQAEAVEWLLASSAAEEQLEHRDRDGNNPLLVAVRGRHDAVIGQLLTARACVNVADEQGRTPLLFALALNSMDCTLRLIQSQADINARDEDGRSVLHCLVVNQAKHKCFRTETACGVAAALEARADLEAAGEHGGTALMVAAQGNEPLLCALMIAYGANVAAMDLKERTALVLARTKHLSDVCRVLTEFGEDHGKPNRTLDRILLRSVYYGNTAACKQLLKRGADHTQTTKRGKALREIASNLGHSGVLRLLKDTEAEAKASVDDQDALGMHDRQAMQAWLAQIRGGAKVALELQALVRAKDIAGILHTVDQLTREQAKPRGPVRCFTADLLAQFSRERCTMMLRQVTKDLRSIRAAERQRLIRKLSGDLLTWDASEEHSQPQLQKIAAHGVHEVRGLAAISDFEAADGYTQRLEEAQGSCIEPSLRLAYEIPSVYAEEVQAYGTFPQEESRLPLEDLECPKCGNYFGHSKALKEHARFCHSKARKVREEEFQQRQLARAESAVHVLESSAHMYRTKAAACQAVLREVAERRRRQGKELPEAVAVLASCCTFVEAIGVVCWNREEVCARASSELSRKWGLAGGRQKEGKGDSLICRKCLVKMTSRCAQHEDCTKPCAVLCSACAFELGIEIQEGKAIFCPGCEKLMSGTITLQSRGNDPALASGG